MKLFETPTIDIEKLNVADVIATSCPTDDGCDGYDPNGCGAFECPFD